MMKKQPVLLGIVGDSATGKTTISAGIRDILGADRVITICADDYHKYNRVERKKYNISALHPDCNFIDILEQHLCLLRAGKPILKPVYNHSTGDFDRPEYIEPKDFIIVEGLLCFYTKKLREKFDVKVYLDPEEDLRLAWKLKRDTSKRGYTKEQVIESLKKRAPISKRYIRPQRQFADIVVSFYRPKGHENETGSHLNVTLILRPTLRHPDFSAFLDPRPDIRERCLSISLGRDEGLPVDFLNIKGIITPMTAETLMDLIWSHLPDGIDPWDVEIGQYYEGKEKKISYPLAITQLLTTYHLLNVHLNNE